MALQQILSLLPVSPKNGKTILANLHQVRNDLHEICCKAATKCTEHLNSLLDATHATNDKQNQNLYSTSNKLKRTEDTLASCTTS